MEEIEELKQKLNEAVATTKQLEEKIKELEEEKKYVRWKPCKNGTYWLINESGKVSHQLYNSDFDEHCYDIGNFFETEREAQIVAEKLKIYTKLKDLALRLNNGKKIDWNDDTQRKHHLFYCQDTCKIKQDVNIRYKYLNTIYCLDSEFKDEAIKEIGEENLKKLFI